MLIGYARVSTNEQNLDLQRDALLKAGVSAKDIYTDKITGVKADRPGLTLAISHLRKGDTLIAWRLDRLGRSLKHLIETVTLTILEATGEARGGSGPIILIPGKKQDFGQATLAVR